MHKKRVNGGLIVDEVEAFKQHFKIDDLDNVPRDLLLFRNVLLEAFKAGFKAGQIEGAKYIIAMVATETDVRNPFGLAQYLREMAHRERGWPLDE